MLVKTVRDVLNGRSSGEITCAKTGKAFRRLSVTGEDVVMDACDGNPPIRVPIDTPLFYQPSWFFGHGVLLFPSAAVREQGWLVEQYIIPKYERLLFCGEGDIIRYDDSTEDGIYPARELVSAGHGEQIAQELS